MLTNVAAFTESLIRIVRRVLERRVLILRRRLLEGDTGSRLTEPMQQAAVISIAVKDNQNDDPATSMMGSVPKASSNQGKHDPTKVWMADIEPLSIVINVVGGC